jgi:hypothetical protein
MVGRKLGVANGGHMLTPYRVALIPNGSNVIAVLPRTGPEQGGKPLVVQPVAMEPSIGSKGGVGVVIHLSKIREK